MVTYIVGAPKGMTITFQLEDEVYTEPLKRQLDRSHYDHVPIEIRIGDMDIRSLVKERIDV